MVLEKKTTGYIAMTKEQYSHQLEMWSLTAHTTKTEKVNTGILQKR